MELRLRRILRDIAMVRVRVNPHALDPIDELGYAVSDLLEHILYLERENRSLRAEAEKSRDTIEELEDSRTTTSSYFSKIRDIILKTNENKAMTNAMADISDVLKMVEED